MSREKEQKDTQKKTTEAPEVTDFMKEEIRQRPVNRRRLARRTLITVIMAVIFGAVACLVFLLLEPVINNMLNPVEEPAEVSFTEEIVEVEEEMSPEDMIADDQEIQEAAAEEIAANSVDAITQEVLDEVQKQLEEGAAEETDTGVDAELLWEELMTRYSELLQEVQRFSVTVTAITSEYDWVGASFSSTGSVSGLIVAQRGDSVLILADNEGLSDAEEIRITFHDGQQAQAQLVCIDTITGLTILSVDEGDLDAPLEENDEITICVLGSSYTDLTGEPVIAVGSPTGATGSVICGIVTGTGTTLDVEDAAFEQITTNIYGSTEATGALVNTDGMVIGWIDMDNSPEDAPNLICAIGISQMKALIENLSNGTSMGYLGIHGTDIPESIRREQGIPEGAYVVRTEMDSPAMEAGIQAGDIITALNGNAVSSYEDVVDILSEVNAGRYLSVTIQRYAQDAYEEVDLSVQLAERFEMAE